MRHNSVQFVLADSTWILVVLNGRQVHALGDLPGKIASRRTIGSIRMM
jgi:hypothetical protein